MNESNIAAMTIDCVRWIQKFFEKIFDRWARSPPRVLKSSHRSDNGDIVR